MRCAYGDPRQHFVDEFDLFLQAVADAALQDGINIPAGIRADRSESARGERGRPTDRL
jgi:hypothetical protein